MARRLVRLFLLLFEHTLTRTIASLLFTAPGKASASCNPNPTISTPLPSHLLLLPSHLRTPSPGVHRYASFNLSPGVEEDMEMDEIEPVQEDMSDRVVEGAGRSSWNYGQSLTCINIRILTMLL